MIAKNSIVTGYNKENKMQNGTIDLRPREKVVFQKSAKNKRKLDLLEVFRCSAGSAVVC